MNKEKIIKGSVGEELTCKYLMSKGYRIAARNYRSKFGEIDIIACNERCIAFVEVKTRNGNQYGYPSESVSPAKQQRIRKSAEIYLQNRRATWQKVSFDVYEIMTDLIEDCM